jgi:hypothetical protein
VPQAKSSSSKAEEVLQLHQVQLMAAAAHLQAQAAAASLLQMLLLLLAVAGVSQGGYLRPHPLHPAGSTSL